MRLSQQEIAAPQAVNTDANASAKAANEPQEKKKYFTTKRMTLLAVFVALAVVLKLIGKALTITPSFTVSFIYLPWLLSGVVAGPIGGAIVGAISDLIGMLVYGGSPIPLTLLSNTLYPVWIGLVYRFVPIKNDYIKSIIGALLSLIFCTLGFGSLGLYYYYDYSSSMNFFQYLIAFRMTQVGVFAVNLVVFCLLIKPLQNIGIYPISTKTKPIITKQLFYGASQFIITALLITAIIVAAVNGFNSWVLYTIISLIFISLSALLCFIVLSNKHNIAKFILLGISALAIIAALIIMLATRSAISDIAIKYFFPALAAGIAIFIIVFSLIRKKLKDKEKHL